MHKITFRIFVHFFVLQISNYRRAIGGVYVPLTKLFPRLVVGLNKTILNHVSLQRPVRVPIPVRGIFPDVIKFLVAAHIRYRRKQSGSGIRTMIRIGLRS